MTLAANSYGTTEKVAGMVPRYAASSGDFDASTNPTKARVEGMLDRVSGLVNAYLKALGFSVPLSNSDNVLAVENIVIEVVTEMVEGVRGSGRYAPNSKAIAAGGMVAVLNADITGYLDAIANGLEQDETRNKTGNRPSSTAVVKVDYAFETD